jgi:hypothetical protein
MGKVSPFAARFDGASSLRKAITLTSNTVWSMGGWFQVDAVTLSKVFALMTIGNATQDHEILFDVDSEVWYWDSGARHASPNVNKDRNVWIHIAATKASATDTKVFVNGQVIIASTASTSRNADNFIIGSWFGDDSQEFPGLCRNVFVYDRALHSGEIMRQMESDPPIDLTSLISWYGPNTSNPLLDDYIGDSYTVGTGVAPTIEKATIPKPLIKTRFIAVDVPEDTRHAVVEKPWTEQPPAGAAIDRTNPLASKIKFAFVPNSSGGVDSVTKKSGALTVTNGSPSAAVSEKGQILRSLNDASTSHGKLQFNGLSIDLTDGVTVFTVIRRDTTGANYWEVVTQGYAPVTGARACGLSASHQTGRTQYMEFGSPFGATASDRLTDGEWQTFAASAPYSATANVRFFIDGVLTDTTSPIDSASNSTVTKIDIAHVDTWPTETFGGDIAAVYWFEGELTAGEHAALAANPWQVFEPQKIFAPIDEKLPDLATFEKEHTSMPARPPK